MLVQRSHASTCRITELHIIGGIPIPSHRILSGTATGETTYQSVARERYGGYTPTGMFGLKGTRMTDRITRKQAAQIAIIAQMLGSNPRRKPTRDDLRQLIDRIAMIQIDTISVVARSPYVIPWSRLGAYDPNWLDQLLHPERTLFEYWGHAASLIDTSLLPCFFSRMEERRQKYDPSHHAWTSQNVDLIDHVRQQVYQHGPLTTLHFERPDPDQPVEPWAWYGGKPTNRAFDYLWLTGEVSIHRRFNFRREYDLIERVLPQVKVIEQPDIWTERLTLADRALQAMGIARPEWLNDYFRTKWGTRNDSPPGPTELLDCLVKRERAVPVEIDELGPAYVSVDQLDALDDVRHGYAASSTTLLSPFDNLIWDRQRTLELFDFEYRIECYTPEAKRIYGYFTFPILRRGRLVGRVDPKIDRKSGVFYVRSLHLEPGVRLSKRLVEDLRGTLRSFARWNGASQIVSENVAPEIAGAVDGMIE